MTNPDSPPPRQVGREGKKASILVIDDEESIRRFLRHVLEGAGFLVTETRTGFEGLQQYRRAPTDMVIVDLLLPDIDGIDVIAELQWVYPELKILAITGGSGSHDFLEVAEKVGACQALRKPFTLDALLRALRDMGQREPRPSSIASSPAKICSELRKYQRFETSCPVAFSSDQIQGQGRLVNVSLGGCEVESSVSVAPGAYLRLEVTLLSTDGAVPLEVEVAAVRWSAKGQFGAEFISLQPDAQQRLRQFIRTL